MSDAQVRGDWAMIALAQGLFEHDRFTEARRRLPVPDPGLVLLRLVEFEPDRVPGLLGMAKLEEELSALMGGKTIDLRTAGDLSRYFRDDIIRTAQTRYAA